MLDPNVAEDLQELPERPENQRPKDSFYLPRLIFLSFAAVCILSVGVFILYAAFNLPPLYEIENPESNLSTQVISADGEVLDNFFYRENRVPVRLNEMSPYVKDALIATEDARFFQHAGVDYWSIPSLLKRNLSGTTSGGSTITMQLARNLFNAVSRERTVFRKIKEVIVSAILERYYTKQEIMEAYLNTVNIYGNSYGIEMASRRLFDKGAKDLSIDEAAVIVAMLKGQGVYDPIRNREAVIERRNLVIDLMVRHRLLDPDTLNLDSIKNRPLVVVKKGLDHEIGVAPYFREHVRQFMKDWCKTNFKANGKPYDLYTDGLRVFTTIDARMQRHAEAAVQQHLQSLQTDFDKHIKGREPYKSEPAILQDLKKLSERYLIAKRNGKSDAEIDQEFNIPVRMRVFSWKGEIDTTFSPMDSLKYYARFLETGFVAVDPQTGQIKTWVGGINYKYFKYDHVALGRRQVGSTFKPFVYAAAIDNGRTPCDMELNQPVVFENIDGAGGIWSPKNSDGGIGGFMTLRSALATSTNLVTARLMKQLGPERVIEYARKLGVTSPMDPVPALCLGVADLTVLELTGAYTTFATNGTYTEPYFVTRIEDRRGNVLAEFRPASREALSPQTAFTMVQMMRGVADDPGGTAQRLRSRYGIKSEVAAKTGTTQNHSDGWFVGVTPNMSASVWVGCADRRMRFRSISLGQGANMALPVWAIFMKRLYEDPAIALPKESFQRPPGYNDKFTCTATGSYSVGSDGQNLPTSSDDLGNFE